MKPNGLETHIAAVVLEERAANPPLLTFDPVTLVQVDLALGLGGIGAHHHEVSSRDGAVQLSPWP